MMMMMIIVKKTRVYFLYVMMSVKTRTKCRIVNNFSETVCLLLNSIEDRIEYNIERE